MESGSQEIMLRPGDAATHMLSVVGCLDSKIECLAVPNQVLQAAAVRFGIIIIPIVPGVL
jgi:hypothetical protein